MVTRPKADPVLTDVAVRAELFHLNLQDELAGRQHMTADDMQAAFVRALQNTVVDLRGIPPVDTAASIKPSPNPVRPRGPRLSRRWRTGLIAACVAFGVAAVLRLGAFLILGQ